MSFKIFNSPDFNKELKRLSSKYPSLKIDFQFFLDSLLENPVQRISLGNNFYKIRLAISSKRRGKSGWCKNNYLCTDNSRKHYFIKHL